MTTVDTRRGAAPRAARPGGALTGYGNMLRFMLRRDRSRFPSWTLGLTMLLAYFSTVLPIVFPETEDLEAFAVLSSNPAAALLMGPGFAGYDLSLGLFLAGTYGLYLMIGAAIMSILTIARHTRVEEQSGRAELVRASVVGRHAPLSAALTVAALMNIVIAVLMGAMLVGLGFDPAGAFALGAAVGAAGLAFAGITAACVQLTAFSRTASGIAGVVLGAAFVVRGLGDMAQAQNTDAAWLSWLSPLGWSQKVVPFGANDWMPLLLSIACFVVFAVIGFALADRRDLAAGLVPPRRGSPHAAAWLASSFALAFRLQRAAIIGWTASMLAMGLVYGSFTQAMIDGFSDAPPAVLALFGGEDDMLTGYLGMMGLLIGMITAIFAILSVQGLRSEEDDGRSEPVLAAAVSRPAWLGSWLGVAAIGIVVMLLAGGIGEAVGVALSTGSGDLFWQVVWGHTVHAPAVWVVLAVAALLYGVAPRWLGLAWILFGFSFFMGFFGQMLDVPEWVEKLSPFAHIGRYPGGELSAVAILVLTGIAAVIAALALAAYRRRDLRGGA